MYTRPKDDDLQAKRKILRHNTADTPTSRELIWMRKFAILGLKQAF
jgi:hypothetical protein